MPMTSGRSYRDDIKPGLYGPFGKSTPVSPDGPAPDAIEVLRDRVNGAYAHIVVWRWLSADPGCVCETHVSDFVHWMWRVGFTRHNDDNEESAPCDAP